MTAFADKLDTLLIFGKLILTIVCPLMPDSLTTGHNFWYKYYTWNARHLRSTNTIDTSKALSKVARLIEDMVPVSPHTFASEELREA